ncbi:unnamed protein product, partial [marine sediment metagenome]
MIIENVKCEHCKRTDKLSEITEHGVTWKLCPYC